MHQIGGREGGGGVGSTLSRKGVEWNSEGRRIKWCRIYPVGDVRVSAIVERCGLFHLPRRHRHFLWIPPENARRDNAGRFDLKKLLRKTGWDLKRTLLFLWTNLYCVEDTCRFTCAHSLLFVFYLTRRKSILWLCDRVKMKTIYNIISIVEYVRKKIMRK